MHNVFHANNTTELDLLDVLQAIYTLTHLTTQFVDLQLEEVVSLMLQGVVTVVGEEVEDLAVELGDV